MATTSGSGYRTGSGPPQSRGTDGGMAGAGGCCRAPGRKAPAASVCERNRRRLMPVSSAGVRAFRPAVNGERLCFIGSTLHRESLTPSGDSPTIFRLHRSYVKYLKRVMRTRSRSMIAFRLSSAPRFAVALGVAALTSVGLLAVLQAQSPTPRMPQGFISGTVESSKGREAGVWVIAQTTQTPTPLTKIVVTGDDGRFVVPELPNVAFNVWVRGYGLVDSKPV